MLPTGINEKQKKKIISKITPTWPLKQSIKRNTAYNSSFPRMFVFMTSGISNPIYGNHIICTCSDTMGFIRPVWSRYLFHWGSLWASCVWWTIQWLAAKPTRQVIKRNTLENHLPLTSAPSASSTHSPIHPSCTLKLSRVLVAQIASCIIHMWKILWISVIHTYVAYDNDGKP